MESVDGPRKKVLYYDKKNDDCSSYSNFGLHNRQSTKYVSKVMYRIRNFRIWTRMIIISFKKSYSGPENMLNLGLPNCMFLSKSPIKCPEGTLHFPKNDSSVRVSIGMASFTFLMLLCNLFSHSLRPLQKLEWIQTLLVTSL